MCPRFLRNVKVPALSTECGIVILTHAAQFASHVPTFFSLTDRAQCIDMCNTKFLDARRRCGIIMITIGAPILGDRDAGQECPSPSNSRISKLLPSTVGLIGTYSVGQLPNSMAFDGTNLWVTRAGNNVASIPAIEAPGYDSCCSQLFFCPGLTSQGFLLPIVAEEKMTALPCRPEREYCLSNFSGGS